MNSLPILRLFNVGSRLLSIVATGVLWHITYIYIYKKITSDSEYEFKNSDDYSDCYKVIRMKIPSYSKGGIIGKNGSTIRKIQDKTKTTIKFLNKNFLSVESSEDKQSDWSVDVNMTNVDDQNTFEILLIRGLTLRVMEAEKEIKSIIASIPIYNEEFMTVDNRFVGKIIGKKGENVKRLKDCYKVQIDIDRSESSQRKISIRGTAENIAECRRDIVKTIDLIMKENKNYVLSNDERPRFSVPVASCSNINIISLEDADKCQYVKYPMVLNEKTYIYVSSVVDCCKFYAHIVSDDLKALSNLCDEMNVYFSCQGPDLRTTFSVGDIVAGYYASSHTWQRVKIIDTKDNLFEIIYLDYGDSAFLNATELKTFDNCKQFLDLPFQALRLITHGIKPINDNGWSDSDINKFEILTKVGHCHQIAAYLKSKHPQNFEVKLIDETTCVDIGKSLIDDGIALPKYEV